MLDYLRQPNRYSAAISTSLVLLLLLCARLSWPALSGPFLFDDFPNLSNLETLGGRLDWHSLANFSAQYSGEPGRPLSMLSFVINDYAWPSDPWSFKYTNLMLHLLVGVLVFGFARCLARLQLDPRRADLAALLAAAAWLLHPMQLSTTMLVVQRMTQLSALFALMGLWGYCALASRVTRPQMALVAIATLGCATVLAALSKETGALTPLLAVVVNATLLRSRLRELPSATRRVLQWGTSLPVLLMVAVIAWRWNSVTSYGTRDFDMYERLLTQARVLVNYLYQILVPNLGGGGIYHDDFLVSRGLLHPWTTLPAIALICALVASALAWHRRNPLLAFAVLWFFSGHLLESTVFPLELYFEHRNYLPMFGPLFVLATSVVRAAERWRTATFALAAAWILFTAWLTCIQAPIWGDVRKLTAVWAIEHPQSPRATQQRADYLERYRSEHLAAEVLLSAYRRGVRGADFPLQVLNLGCAHKNEALAEQAWPLVRDSLTSAPYDNALLETIGRMRRHVQSAACPDILTEESWLALTNLLLSNPAYANGGGSKYLHVERSYLFRNRRDLNATMRELEAAWASGPTPALAQLIAATLASAKLYDEAELWAEKALEQRVRGVRGWLSMDDVKSRRLLDALESAKENRAREEGSESGRATNENDAKISRKEPATH